MYRLGPRSAIVDGPTDGTAARVNPRAALGGAVSKIAARGSAVSRIAVSLAGGSIAFEQQEEQQ
jgi:hypothetical protein